MLLPWVDPLPSTVLKPGTVTISIQNDVIGRFGQLGVHSLVSHQHLVLIPPTAAGPSPIPPPLLQVKTTSGTPRSDGICLSVCSVLLIGYRLMMSAPPTAAAPPPLFPLVNALELPTPPRYHPPSCR